MKEGVHKTLIGFFVICALILLTFGIAILGSGAIFKKMNKFVLYFDGSVKGLAVGAPVMFRGVSIGFVKDISLIYDAKLGTIMLPVIVEIEEGRIKGAPSFGELDGDKKMIGLGLRGKLEVQSFLTGQLMIAFDFYPDKKAQMLGIIKGIPELPTLPTSPDIFELMNDLPIKEITKNLEKTSLGIERLVNSSGLQGGMDEVRNTLVETKKAMTSFRLLTEYLELHPESIFKGKTAF